MKKALVTGGAGFIGLQLSKKLHESGCSVNIIDNFSRGVKDNELDAFIALDTVNVYDNELVNNPDLSGLGNSYDYIFHLAAIIGVSNVLKNPYHVLADNTMMLINMLEFAKRQSHLKRFIFTSTSEIYSGTLQHFTLPIPTPETTPLAITNLKQPRSSYMLSKIYGEALCHHSGLPFTIIRPHNIYGPRMGMAHVIPELLKKAHELPDGGELDVFSVKHSRTFCFIDDGVEMIVKSAEAPACEGEALNVGNQEPELPIRDVAQIVIDTVGKSLTIKAQPETPGSPSRRCPDMTKTGKLLGKTASVSIKQGIQKTYEWYEKNVF
ncbi:NAD-dependent epimerase/dehydratase family protein [Candidatus Latescibacterota bacterium]